MKHLKKGRKFGREKKQREALMKNLLGSLLSRGKIMTTEAKAKDLRVLAEKNLARVKKSFSSGKASPKGLRLITQHLPKNVSTKRIQEISEMLAAKSSGFTKITKAGQRKSDSASIAIIELIV